MSLAVSIPEDCFATPGIAGTTVPAQVHASRGVDGSVGTFFVSVILKGEGRIHPQIYSLFNPLVGAISTLDLSAMVGFCAYGTNVGGMDATT
jgi:hypothetical protein